MSGQSINRRTFLKLAGACALFPSVLVSPRAAWAGQTPENLDNLLEPIRATHFVPALAAAFVRGPDLVALGAVGLRNADAPERVQLNDRFHLGSCTKSMTATLIALLIEQGKLSWETTVADVFPDLVSRIRSEYHKVTPVQLLAHRAGVIRDPASAFLWGPTGPRSRREVTEWILAQPFVATPGSSYNYSNSGYIVAGSIVEQVMGKSWEELTQEMLFKPLGMEASGFGAPGTPGALDQPWGHRRNGCQPVAPGPRADNHPVYGPAGTAHCSLSDWARYASLHLRGARGEEGLLLKPESFQQLHRDFYQQNYALGWALARRDWAGGVALAHNGSNTYWFAVIWIAPQRNALF